MLKGIKWSVVPLPCFSLWPKSSFGKQGSGPDRGQSPVEWEDFPYVCPSICLSIHTSPLLSIKPGLRPSQPGLKPDARLAGPQAWLAGPQAWLDDSKGRTDEWTNRRDEKSSHSTGLCPLLGLLPKTTMQSICYLKLPWVCLGTIYPICDHDPHSSKMAKNMPKTTRFYIVHVRCD